MLEKFDSRMSDLEKRLGRLEIIVAPQTPLQEQVPMASLVSVDVVVDGDGRMVVVVAMNRRFVFGVDNLATLLLIAHTTLGARETEFDWWCGTTPSRPRGALR